MARSSPLPPRNGVDAVRIRLADPGQGPRSIPEELRRRFPERSAEIAAALAAGDVVTSSGRAVTEHTPRHRGMDVWTYRQPHSEPEVPFDIEILYQDERIIVVDKPHFLATAPRAGHVTETALVRLRRLTGIDHLAPAHRLDRVTAGVLLFVADPRYRGRYQTMFAARNVEKNYLAVAPAPPNTPTVQQRDSRIVKTRGTLQAVEVEGEPDAHTTIVLLDTALTSDGVVGLYRLMPLTGRTHQLRLHMAALGTPIVDDDLYPEVVEQRSGDFCRPLQLLAHTLSFTDPVDGTPRVFRSNRVLQRWPGPWPVPDSDRYQGEDSGSP